MRASRQTELERLFPRHVVCAWMGNSTRDAEKNYLLVTEEDYTKALELNQDGDSHGSEAAQQAAQLDSKTTQNPAQDGARKSTQAAKKNRKTRRKTAFLPRFAVLS